jgi:hypothetical protein
MRPRRSIRTSSPPPIVNVLKSCQRRFKSVPLLRGVAEVKVTRSRGWGRSGVEREEGLPSSPVRPSYNRTKGIQVNRPVYATGYLNG